MKGFEKLNFSNATVDQIFTSSFDICVQFGIKLVIALLVLFVGKKIINYLNKIFVTLLKKKEIEPSVESFLRSLVNISLTIVLSLFVISILGVDNSSIIALLASGGVAVGFAISGTLQNFAGGVMILLFKPYRIGDYIEAQNQGGTVKEIQIFNTVLITADNKTVYIPNGGLATGVVTNLSRQENRRLEIIIGVGYGQSFDRVKLVIEKILNNEPKVIKDPEFLVALHKLNSSSVDIVIRAWTKKENYWDVYFNLNKQIYEIFSKENIDIPFPHMTVHMAKKL